MHIPPFNAMARYSVPLPPLPQFVAVYGASGHPYRFAVVPFSDLTDIECGAVYIIVRSEHNRPGHGLGLVGLVTGIGVPGYFLRFGYVGMTCALNERHADHHRSDAFKRFGADVALVCSMVDERQRRLVELDIRRQYDPPLNRE